MIQCPRARSPFCVQYKHVFSMHFLRNDGSIISHGNILMNFFHANVNMLNLVSDQYEKDHMSSSFFNKFVKSTELTKNMKEKTQAVLGVL